MSNLDTRYGPFFPGSRGELSGVYCATKVHHMRRKSMTASYFCFIVIAIGIGSANIGCAADLGSENTHTPATEHGCKMPSDQNIEDWRSEALTGYRGNADSQNLLGLAYSLGCGVPQDYEQALGWFRLAAEQGDAAAQNELGAMYALGLGTPQNFDLAVKWYELSADQGNASAQGELGVMYANGSGVQKNKIVAFALFKLCTEKKQFDPHRILVNRAYLAMSMTVREINESGTLAGEMARPGNLLKSIEQFITRTAVLSSDNGHALCKALARVDGRMVSGGCMATAIGTSAETLSTLETVR